MGLGYTEEIVTKVAPTRLLKADNDIHNLVPLIMPDIVAGIKILEGDGGAGTIKQIDFTEAFPWDYVKERVDVLDKEKYEFHYTLFEGGDFGKKLKSASYKLKLVPLPDGGCVYRITVEYDTIPGVELSEEDMKKMKEMDIGEFKALEAYLLANPAAYT